MAPRNATARILPSTIEGSLVKQGFSITHNNHYIRIKDGRGKQVYERYFSFEITRDVFEDLASLIGDMVGFHARWATEATVDTMIFI